MSALHRVFSIYVVILLVGGSRSAAAAVTALTAQEVADQAYMRAKTAGREHYALNLADPTEHRFYMTHLARAGFSKEKSPQFFRVLEQQRQAHLAGQYRPYDRADFIVNTEGVDDDDPISVVNAINTITSLTSGGGAFGTTAVSSVAGGTEFTAITLELHDAASNALLAPVVSGGDTTGAPLYSIETAATTSSTAAYAQSTSLWVDRSGVVRGPNVQTLTTAASSFMRTEVAGHGPEPMFTLPTLTNLAPRNRANPSATITVCLVDRSNCDYDGGGLLTLVLPLRGNAVYPFGVSLTNNKPTSGRVFWKIIDATVGGGCSAFGGANSIATFFVGPPKTTVSTAPGGATTVAWDWSSTTFSLPGAPCRTNGHEYKFVFLMEVPAPIIANGVPQDVVVQVTSAPPATPGTNAVKIGNIRVVSGCLAPGTAITLADGTPLPIDKFKADGEKVRSANGRTLTVTNAIQGTETRPMVRIVDAQGHTLLLTDDHPVVTKNRGAVAASSLSTADSVLTDAGASRLTSVTRVPYHGPIYNLDLGEVGEVFGAAYTTMYANHILVGDWKMQNAAVEAVRRSPEQIYAGMAPEWREDYLNSLDAATAARLRGKQRKGGRP